MVGLTARLESGFKMLVEPLQLAGPDAGDLDPDSLKPKLRILQCEIAEAVEIIALLSAGLVRAVS